MSEIDYLIDKILDRNQEQVGEDQEYKHFLKVLFSDYTSREATDDLIYDTVISNKLKYWFDIRQKIVWKPIFNNFNGVYMLDKEVLLDKLPIHSYRNEFIQHNKTTPLEWMSIHMTYGNDYNYNDKFRSRLSNIFYYTLRDEKNETQMKKLKFFENTLIAALDLSISLYTDNIEKIEITNKKYE